MAAARTDQRHEGTLRIGPASVGVRATVRISENNVAISMADGEMFSFALWQVRGRPYDSRTVILDIRDEEDLYFVADDPLAFAEVALPQFTRDREPAAEGQGNQVTQRRTSSRWRLPVLGISARSGDPEGPQRVPVRRNERGESCVHDWRTLHVSGLVRRVCNQCKTVSIDLTE